jgi:septum formation protein
MLLILASTSSYRKAQLKQLGFPFDCKAPNVDEDSFKNSNPEPAALAALLAQKKAEAIWQPGLCVIGGDQLVSFNNQILGKPKTFDRAIEMLSMLNGQTHELITAVYVTIGTKKWQILDRTLLTMRKLHREQIISYLRFEKPYDCAGSYKIEGRGITLFEKIESKDFTAIQGLPLIELTTILQEAGIQR